MIIDKLTEFVERRPGIDSHNYDCARTLRAERQYVSNQRKTYYALLAKAKYIITDEDLLEQVNDRKGRLRWNDKECEFDYITGQYFATEYRRAACDALFYAVRTKWIRAGLDPCKMRDKVMPLCVRRAYR